MVATINPNGTDVRDELAAIAEFDARRARLMEPEPEEVRSIFDGMTSPFARYRVEIRFRAKLMGGVPKAPDVIEGWLRSKAGVTDEAEIGHMTALTLAQRLGVDPGSADIEDMIAASREVAASKSTNGFKADGDGLYVEGRQVKALLKEVTNIVYAGEKWGPTRKGARNFVAERVFVVEDRIHLGRTQPDGIEQVIGHVSGPQGARSTLTYHEYVFQPTCSFTLMSHRDCIKPDQWVDLLILAQEEGLGALRSQGHGRFSVQAFDKL